MNSNILRAHINNPVSRIEITKRYCRAKSVLDVGCVNHNMENVGAANWLHKSLVEVASSVLGVDYLELEIRELAERGYRVVAADVTKPLDIQERFDVIVIGHLIEHLSNFEGLMQNIRQLLKPNGCALISTPNPFYREQYFYSAFKNDVIVNPEHTCWLDPVTLDQLARRFELETSEVYWIKEKWPLRNVILHSDSRFFDILTGKWNFDESPTVAERLISPFLNLAFRLLPMPDRHKRLIEKYGHRAASRMPYLYAQSAAFGAFWALYRMFIVTSPINRHEVFLSVLKRA